MHLNCFKIELYLNLIQNLKFKTWFEIGIESWKQKIEKENKKKWMN